IGLLPALGQVAGGNTRTGRDVGAVLDELAENDARPADVVERGALQVGVQIRCLARGVGAEGPAELDGRGGRGGGGGRGGAGGGRGSPHRRRGGRRQGAPDGGGGAARERDRARGQAGGGRAAHEGAARDAPGSKGAPPDQSFDHGALLPRSSVLPSGNGR